MINTRLLLKSALALSFCFTFSVGYAANFGADRHVAKGIPCEACHGANMDKSSPEIPEEAACIKCHDKKALAEKTRIFLVPILTPPHTMATALCAICSMKRRLTTALNATSSISKSSNQKIQLVVL